MVWDGDDWEFFVAASRGAAYRQLCVAPNGASTRQVYKEDTGEWQLREKVLSDTTAPDRWTVRLALPLERLLAGPLTRGSTFYANLYRASPGATALLAWAPVFASGSTTPRLPQDLEEARRRRAVRPGPSGLERAVLAAGVEQRIDIGQRTRFHDVRRGDQLPAPVLVDDRGRGGGRRRGSRMAVVRVPIYHRR